MTSPTRRATLATVAIAALLAVSATQAAEPTQQQLMEQIQQLQKKVDALETQQQTAVIAEEQATIGSVLNDADRRAQLLDAEGFTAGYNKGSFTLQSADGNFVANIGAHFQFRWVGNNTEDAAGDDDFESGFELRRMKVSLTGNAFTPLLKYNFQWGTDRDEGTFELEDAYLQYRLGENSDWAIRGGQFKSPVFHEELVSSKRQLAVDRSLLNEVLGGGLSDFVQGVGLIYDTQNGFRGELAYHDGIMTDNTDFLDSGGSAFAFVDDPGWGVAGRAEYRFMGDWNAYQDFTALGTEEDLFVVGGGFDFTQDGDTNAILHTLDAQYESAAGWSLYGAYHGLMVESGDILVGTEDSIYDTGFLVQGGYLLSPKWEIFARYDILMLDDERPAAAITDEVSEIVIGFNRYCKGHAAKATVDFFYLPDGKPVGLPNTSGIGILGQGSDEDQYGVRAQFQLVL